jgi:RNA methyltransferase, TrmH family
LLRPSVRISSRRHPIVQRCRRLARSHGGQDVLLDGEHLVAEALRAGVRIQALLTTRATGTLARQAAAAGADVYEATHGVLEAASPVAAPTDVVAIARWTPRPLADLLAAAPTLLIGLHDVQDPGNVGAVIRSADGLGASGVICIDRTADPAGWRALRGAMGSTFRLPVARARLADALREAARLGVRVAATVAGQGQPAADVSLAPPLLLLLGNEGAGLPESVASRTTLRVTIPMRPGVNSLNVAVTAGVLLYEAARQRGPTRSGP